MSDLRKPRPALIVDPDPSFLTSLLSAPQALQLPPLVAKTGKDAQLQLANTNLGIAGLFVNLAVENTSGYSVIRFSHMHRPATPIFIIHDPKDPVSEEDMDKLGVQKALPKPLTYSQIMGLVTPTAMMFDVAGAIEVSQQFQDKLDAQLTTEDAAFVPINAADFLSGSKCFFDLYVRLGPGRFVKILQAGDSFSFDRIAAYLRKGVTHFFLRKEAQEKYLGYCDKLASAVVRSAAVPVAIKISQTMNHGQETMNFLKKHGLNENNLQYAANFISNVEVLATQMEKENVSVLRGFLADLAAYEHGVATAMIAALLIHPLRIEAAQPVRVIGIGSLMHDIGLYRMDEAMRDENEAKMTPEQIEVYKTHPIVGAEILKSMRGVDPVVIQAVAQHHERRNKKGFPLRLGAGAINRVAEIIGISDELAKLIERAKLDPAINPLQDMELTILAGFSNPIVEAFKKVFGEVNQDG